MTDLRATQVSVEEWGSIIPPQMQATQLATEMWAAVSTVNTLMTVTQVGLEMWSSVAVAATAGPRQSLIV